MLKVQIDVRVILYARLIKDPAFRGHLPGHDQRLRLGTANGQLAFYQNNIKSLFHSSIIRAFSRRHRERSLLLALQIGASQRINFNFVTFVNKQRHHDLHAGLHGGWLEGCRSRITFGSRLGLGDFQINRIWHI